MNAHPNPLRGRLVAGLVGAVAALTLAVVPLVVTPAAYAADGAFDAKVLYPAGDQPQAVAIADFNGDGHPDLAVAASVSNSVAILLGAANGTFGATTYLSTAALPYSVATGDFDGDGDVDVVSGNSTGDNVSVFLNAGSGTFGAGTNFSAGNEPSSVAVGDFNEDGDPDLAVSNALSDNVSVLLGTPGGGFGPKTNFPTGDVPYSVAVADFDGDTHLDLAVANQVEVGSVSVLLGTSNGGFGAKTDFPVGNGPTSVAVGYFNGDTDPDLVATNLSSDTVSILLGVAGGGFGPKTDFGTGSLPIAVAVGDFNDDADSDLVVANFGSDTISVLRGNGGGGFAPKVELSLGGGPFGPFMLPTEVAVADFNGDADPDLAVSQDSGGAVAVLLATPVTPVFSVAPSSKPFDSVVVGASSAFESFTVTNTGNAGLAISSVAVAGTDLSQFTINPAPGTNTCTGVSVAPGASCTVQARFTPTSVGAKTAVLRFADNATGSPHEVELSGTGTPVPAPVFSVSPTSRTFGSVDVGAGSGFQSFTVTNTGTAALSISTVDVAGADPSEFAINPDPGTDTCSGVSVAPGGSCSVQVRFEPASVGAKAAVVRFTDNATGSPHEVAVTGTGTPAPLSPQVITFTSAAPLGARVGRIYTPTATGGASGNPLVLTVIPASAGVCSMVAGVVRFEHVGTCVVRGDQAGNGSYWPGVATQSIQVGKGGQSIAFTSTPPASPKPGDTYTPNAQGGASGQPVVLAVASSSAGTCSISSGTVTFASPGTCVLSADQAGNLDYDPAPTASQMIEVHQRVVDPRLTAEVTSARAMTRGWYRTPVTVSFDCTPGSAALVGGCPKPITLSGNGADQHLTRTVTGADGGRATVRVAGIDIDRQRPGVRVKGVTNGGTYAAGRTVRCRATDQHSGVLSCVVTTRRHRQADGDVVVRYRVTATDVAGNQRTKRGHYTIDR
jgi:hypothetical protein